MLVFGKQTVLYLVEHNPQKIKTLYISKDLDKKLYNKLMRSDFELKRTKPEHIQQLCKNGNHQGFLAEIEPIELHSVNELKHLQRIVVLTGLTDVGNIGAIIRSSYALGIDAVVISGVKHIQLEQLARSSSGAIFDLPIVHASNTLDLANMLKQQEFTLYGASMDGEDIKKSTIEPKFALFVGSEGEGLSQKIESRLDKKVSIKMAHDFDSLNVSVATAILIDRMQ
ncbi:MAG: 23S rRNA (guanosine(2251)-2'-O)-methyltransferase RlmB [Thiovulaceae bacterium]|nr:23S rRNA (guanosine(2251)-2'-O)-methyltransferase RlmB [Sulfurimonadaceae bacterium]